ncbi:MAG: protein-L-isoaspartate(D-aspartate) O-methyltransferase [Ignavibacteriota bacterium]|nr:protein-L-isoaspartate(D-aspartate) O-methyltransferase [Ignavibacteriota bacterium]MCE7857998.1 protein-L-isoaspartate(D-aspartate) O-methyltransferase [Ignavibacteria bacterium CHB3]MCZ7612857.1 protein-L-isoaspartate(D-aspartate) O-methyltransferase [Ignavibacteriaceae bacterium]MEB2297926.1 protein-L-isoaspartate(D-aspartate) O-methyltransferase [Ignavibacteria bacterium]QKJ97517.1 MAG: protein-L-isoaspartate(D-aspartate) O-methyltransferase [Ignavibacteriota bacterium]
MYKLQRQELVDSLRQKGISDEHLLSAFQKVEREKFVQAVMKSNAYKDIALPIGYNQTISQPFTIAIMTEALQIKKGEKVLEIGTGSGYQAAILFEMGAKVYSVERHIDIYNEVLKRFEKLRIRVHCKYGDGTLGWDQYSPFDKIIVTAGSPSIPETLKKQLAINGKMVIPVGNMSTQTLKVLTKISDTEFVVEEIPQFAFVPLIGREGWKE